MSQNLRSAFTLIELLIVVGIVAILSAIAVPNFLEAQTRSKVSRSKAELKTVASALEVYRTDFNMYPYNSTMGSAYWERLKPITTPVAYIQALPIDVFSDPAEVTGKGREFCYSPGNFYHGLSPVFQTSQYRATIYSLAGRGPDKKITLAEYCMAHPLAEKGGLRVTSTYDPTNGTVSAGEIIQLSCGRL